MTSAWAAPPPQSVASVEEPVLTLLDLDVDTVRIVCRIVMQCSPVVAARSLCALGGTCRRLRAEVDDAAWWADLWRRWQSSSMVTPVPPPHTARALLCAELEKWCKYAKKLELPTIEQAVACVSRSASAHSYYKHLDIGRSAPFSFHLSLVAGMRRIGDGRFTEYVRGDGTEVRQLVSIHRPLGRPIPVLPSLPAHPAVAGSKPRSAVPLHMDSHRHLPQELRTAGLHGRLLAPAGVSSI